MARGDDTTKGGPPPPRRNPFRTEIQSPSELAEESASSQGYSLTENITETTIPLLTPSQREGRIRELSWPPADSDRPPNPNRDQIAAAGGMALNIWTTLSKIEGFLKNREEREKVAYLRGLLLASLNKRLGYAPIKEASHLRSEEADLLLAPLILDELEQSITLAEGSASSPMFSSFSYFRKSMESELLSLTRG